MAADVQHRPKPGVPLGIRERLSLLAPPRAPPAGPLVALIGRYRDHLGEGESDQAVWMVPASALHTWLMRPPCAHVTTLAPVTLVPGAEVWAVRGSEYEGDQYVGCGVMLGRELPVAEYVLKNDLLAPGTAKAYLAWLRSKEAPER
jgi:hypothetical protein